MKREIKNAQAEKEPQAAFLKALEGLIDQGLPSTHIDTPH